jgi:ABC-type branched-subunit amino acid transport system substrate-binding protein
MGWVPTFYFEGETYARYLLRNRGQSKVAILYQNDEMGREYRDGFKSGLGSNAKRMLVGEASYEISDASVDSQIIQLKATGADALFSAVVTPKFGSQTIRKLDALDWHPLHFIAYPSASVGATLAPAGLDKSVGIISSYFAMDVSDPVNASNPEFKEWKGWFDRYVKDGDPSDGSYAYGYMQAQLLAQVLRQCGNDLSRENVLRQAQHLRNVHLPLTLPGVTINTSDTDYRPIKQLRMFKFNGKKWEGFGPLMGEK